MVVRIDGTSAADRVLADLVALPAVDFVALGTADQPPAALQEQGQPDDPEQGRTLGRVSVPVEGADESVVHEIWEPAAGTVCHGRRPGALPQCSQWTVDTGAIHATFGSPDESPACLSVITGPGVDHVRATAADGTSLEVATTQLHPDLTILELHVACWTDPASRVTGEVVAPDGSVLHRVP